MKLDAPATQRNRTPILRVLEEHFPTEGRVLEVGCGSGQHAAFFAAHFSDLTWHPTDLDPGALASARAWAAEGGLTNVAEGLVLDASGEDWPEGPFDAAFSANVIHISPPEVTPGLLRGVGRSLREGGVFVLYGPFKIEGDFTSESNARFEQWLLARDPSYGVRFLFIVFITLKGCVLEERRALRRLLHICSEMPVFPHILPPLARRP